MRRSDAAIGDLATFGLWPQLSLIAITPPVNRAPVLIDQRTPATAAKAQSRRT
jgi:hypothetical protein